VIVTGLDGQEYRWKMESAPRKNASKPHVRCRELLKSIYKLDQILEEVFLPGADKLYLDFYLPLRKLAVEVDGIQHNKYTPHFHANKLEFFKAQRRDDKKKEWCVLNNIRLVSLSAEDSGVWKSKILNGEKNES
jgi:hypothetical protein